MGKLTRIDLTGQASHHLSCISRSWGEGERDDQRVRVVEDEERKGGRKFR